MIGIIDSEGNTIIEPIFHYGCRFKIMQNIIKVTDFDNRSSLYDLSGKLIISDVVINNVFPINHKQVIIDNYLYNINEISKQYQFLVLDEFGEQREIFQFDTKDNRDKYMRHYQEEALKEVRDRLYNVQSNIAYLTIVSKQKKKTLNGG